MVPRFLPESRVGGDHGVLLVNRQSEMEAVVDRMAEVDSQPLRGGRIGASTAVW